MSRSVCVVGSINVDFVVRAPRFPRPGETLIGEAFETHPGGKGANQAVAASRLGAQVALVGCIGDDENGSRMRGFLAADGLDIHGVRTCPSCSTGVGVITVLPNGDNTIVVAPGANARITAEDVDAAAADITSADVLLLQGEIPPEANQRAIELAKQAGKRVIYNASPVNDANAELLKHVDVLVVNRDEACALIGDGSSDISPTGLARRLATLGPDRIVITLGAEGAVHFSGDELKTTPGFQTTCVDTTAAGDAFAAALAVQRAEGARLKDAVRYACAAGALAVCSVGAIPSLPTKEAVDELLSSQT